MAWSGLFTFGGTEVINASRVEAYAAHHNLSWFKPVYKESDLAWLIGDPEYTTPLQDDAPWTDPGQLNSYDFYGAYPLSVTGFEDSTTSAVVTESVIDGGYIGRTRRGTRAMVFSAVLVGASECAVEYGLRWLRAVLNGGPCFGQVYGTCGGADLCYLSCAPVTTEDIPVTEAVTATLTMSGLGASLSASGQAPPAPTAEDCYRQIARSLHSVTTTTGPNVTAKMAMQDGGEAWTVTWTMVAANPAEFGAEHPLILGFLDPDVEIPYVGGELPPGATFDPDGFVQDDEPCPVPTFQPVYDPTCGLLTPPPDVPTVVTKCFSFPVNYLRRSFTIPSEFIPLWMEVVPVVSLHTGTTEARSVRLRFYADVFNSGNPESDPCNFCGDVVFSYIPPHSTLVLDGTDRIAYIDSPGLPRRRADTLVSDSDGNPFDWPQFSCGFGYIVTVDTPQQGSAAPAIDLALVPRVI